MAGEDGRAVAETRLTLRETVAAVMRLPDDQRALVMLVIVEGHSYREAAEVLDIPIGTVMSRIARARQSLEQAVFGQGREAGEPLH